MLEYNIFDVYKKTEASDGRGGNTYTYTIQAQKERGCISNACSNDVVYGDRFGVKISHVVRLRSSANVDKGDRLISSGITYTVESVIETSSLPEMATKVLVMRLC